MSPTHQLGNMAAPGYVDRRRSYKNEQENRVVTGPTIFTANAGGTTTTIVGAAPNLATGVNVARLDDEFKLFNSSGVLKEETVFRVTAIAVPGAITVTFTPAATVATASGDTYRLVGYAHTQSTADKDRRLVALGVSAARVAVMNENDKDYNLRVLDDPGSL